MSRFADVADFADHEMPDTSDTRLSAMQISAMQLPPITTPSSVLHRKWPGEKAGGIVPRSRLRRLDDFGQATSRAARSLICDLASPVAVGSEPHYRLGPAGAEHSSATRLYAYQWTVRRRADGRTIWQAVTSAPEIRITAATPGRYRVEVVVLIDGSPEGVRLAIDQDVVPEPAILSAALHGANEGVARAMRELVAELSPYIVHSAAATGANGITARLLASVLFIGILGRPKAQRERELDVIEGLLGALERGDRVLFTTGQLDQPLGVGQIRPAVAAMAVGATRWIDRDRDDRWSSKDQTKADYDALPLETKQWIFTWLRWPKSNISVAATLLSKLKNRPGRYPPLTRAELAADRSTVGALAAEYLGAGARTPADDAGPAGCEERVWRLMQESLMQQVFPND